MPLIISLDTSTKACSVALHKDGALIVNFEMFIEYSHSDYLTTLIEAVVDSAGYALKDLDAFAVAKGPGSYTGLRIGVSTAKGICYALDKPLIAIGTLEAMACQIVDFFPSHYAFCPMIDARRMEVYCAILDSELNYQLPVSAEIITQDSFKENLLGSPVVFFGDGAAKCKTILSHSSNAHFLNTQIYPAAKTIGQLATNSFRENNFENLAYFEPFYLKDFVSTKAPISN